MTAAGRVLKDEILIQFGVDKTKLTNLCRAMGVKSLSVFGSVVRRAFVPGQSDIDFLVEFDSVSLDGYFDFLDGLKKIFHYENIDLVTSAALKNRIIRQEILSSQENIYAA